ncbi:MAG: hypothetical protein J7501_09120 [Bdellovibrio sp.]|nr:hypothetical protein [Bdellovibrio sp.]
MLPPWLLALVTEVSVGLVKWAATESKNALQEREAAAEKERADGIRNGKNAQAYNSARTRDEQIRAAINLLNRNNT